MASERTSPLKQRKRKKMRDREGGEGEKGRKGEKEGGREKKGKRVKKGRRGRVRESRCILALSLFATIYFMIHTRSLTVAMERAGSSVPWLAERKNVIFSDKWTVAARGRDVRLNAIVYFVLECSLIPICDVPTVYRFYS